MKDRPKAREDTVFREVGGEWVVYDPRGRMLHGLNLTAALVWSLCSGEHDLDGIVDGVRSALASAPDRETVRRDVVRVLEELREAGLLAP